ncbi:hypothetical protein [Amylibacter sp. IMCC11727]|uniref:hypothetical protein n=1 Tax=Amylibacter sp. IMCC11727 TaxID=3039851 RepID=UPI00244E4025|nr:hypothetical protein [Amylibacter sp. IMCC11727]WGI21296.1 hypothetical protein QBD29_14425 [Amylibacter sp. IMCC11727]
MGMMIFAFAVLFSVLSGWAGALAVASMRGVPAIGLGLVVSAIVMFGFMLLQVGLLTLFGGGKDLGEVLVTAAVLVAALCWIWGPAFGVFYWRTPRVIL